MNTGKKKARFFELMVSILLVISCFLTGCSWQTEDESQSIQKLLVRDETYEKSTGTQTLITDNGALYEREEKIPVLYLAVGRGNEADGTDYTWEQVNASGLEAQGEVPYRCESLLQIGNEIGPVRGEFGFGELTANSTVRLYGKTASTRQQKSYRIDIKDGKGSVDGMKTLILSKCFTDPLRVMNKFCLDLMQKSDSFLSARAELVHLYVKDVSENDDTLYKDYGMYTLMEPVNTRYLKNREIDTGSKLYKAENFDFSAREDVLLNTTDADFSLDSFEQILEIKNGNDNTELLSMLSAVNDENIPIEDVIDTYFDEDNLYSFLAFEILTANRDAATSGYYLLCPTGSTKFWLIAWENSAALRDDYSRLKDPDWSVGWSSGVYIFADNVLVKRILESKECIDNLKSAVEDIYTNVLTRANIKEESSYLKSMTEELIYSYPDRSFARVTEEEYDTLYYGLYRQVVNNYYAFYDSLEQPAPFSIYDPVQENGTLIFRWENSKCFGQNVTYDIAVDDSWDFASPLQQDKGITATEWCMPELPRGQYFVKVTAVSDSGNTQISFEHYPAETKQEIKGVLCFYIQSDRSAAASRFDEE